MSSRLDSLLDFTFEMCHCHHIPYRYNHDTFLEDGCSMCRGCYRNRHGINEVYVPDDVCTWEDNVSIVLAREVFGAELVGKKRKHYYEESEEGKGSLSIVD